MADSKITALTSISTSSDPANDPLVIVDVSDTSMAATGTTKKVTLNQLLATSPTATLASATITGDLTVDTSTLKVDSTNNRVGIGTATPADTLDVNGRVTALRYLSSSSNAALPSFAVSAGNGAYNSGTNEIGFSINSTSAMTLNSTGLGVGVSPGSAIGNLQVGGSTNANLYTQQGTDTVRMGVRASGRTGIILDSSNATYTNRAWYLDNAGSSGSLVIGRQGLDVITFDNSGNVGISVTPSAWSTGKAFEVGAAGNAIWSSTGYTTLMQNAVYNSGYKYGYNGVAAARYDLESGTHKWHIAPSGTAGNAITFTQTMTLDASGNLLVGKTAIGTTVGIEVRPDGYLVATRSATTDGAGFTNAVYSSGAAAYRFYVGMGGTVFATNTTISGISDARLKENVQDIDVGLNAILALKPRKFDWKAGKGKDIKGDRGFIAQEFEQVFPQLVDEWADPAPESETPYKSVRQDLIPVLVKAIQELAAEVNALKKA